MNHILQVGAGFNRDYWARFEKFVKDTVKISDGVFIVTGPLWLPQPDGRGTGKWEMRHPMIGEATWLGRSVRGVKDSCTDGCTETGSGPALM